MMLRCFLTSAILIALLFPTGHTSGMWGFDRLQDPTKHALRVHFELEKDTFLTAEPIFLTILVENTGTEPECCMMQEAWNLDVHAADGSDFSTRRFDLIPEFLFIDTTKPCPPDYWTVYPGKPQGSSSRNLLDYCGKGVQSSLGFYLPEGLYMVSSKLFPSDTLSFRVITPLDSSELAASKLLMSAADNRYVVMSSPDKQYRFYRDFVKDFPMSVYTPTALCWLLAMPAGRPPEYTKAERQSYIQKMIRDFSTSHYLYLALPEFDSAFVKAGDRAAIIRGLQAGRVKLKAEDLRKQIDELVEKLRK